ncbi:MAG TPA: DUF1593 domain-containing protein [Luteitalea sp.]|nr:DUF1593 domain-containing protein [Luteitalea sp.]
MRRLVLLVGLLSASVAAGPFAQSERATDRPRVIVSTDIGGTDPDDFQSMVHLLLYADVLDLEGLVSSPYGPGRREHILEVIDKYEDDYTSLRRHSAAYPDPDRLRAMTKQGVLDRVIGPGVSTASDGSQWIVTQARRNDPRPLWVLAWGGLEDVAQALHDAPDILPKLRVYFIGGPNKMWSVDAYDYIEQHHPGLWMIEANSTYRGWFVGGSQTGDWGNRSFVTAHVAGHGALGAYFTTLLDGAIKMGDSPSLGYVLGATRDDPSKAGWGGRFVPLWEGRKSVFARLTTAADDAEAFGVVEFALPAPAEMQDAARTRMLVDNRIPLPGVLDGRIVRFRFSPRDAKVWPYVIESDVTALNGRSGSFTARMPTPAQTSRRSTSHPQWRIDDPDPAAAEGVHAGARHVSRWRKAYLADFAARLRRTER